MSNLVEMGKKAKGAAVALATLSTPVKNKALLASADAIMAAKDDILAKNKEDVDAALANGIKGAFIDRLTLTDARVADMADGLRQVAKLDDPVGEVLSMKKLDNGLVVGQKRVPMGVIGIIFEARPNVTADAFGLCLKAGSAVILRGGKEAFKTNHAVVNAIRHHTTGKADMSLLEKIIYIADYIEPNRTLSGVDMLRHLAFTDLDAALKAGLQMTVSYLNEQGSEVSPESREALAWLTGKDE